MSYPKARWLAAAAVAATLLANVTACTSPVGGDSSSGARSCAEQTSAKSKQKTTLRFWMLPFINGPKGQGGKPNEWGDAVIKEFEKAHPGVTVKQEMLSYEGYQQKIQTALAAGSPPDVVMAVGSLGGVEKYARLDALAPIDCFVTDQDRDDFTDTAKDAMRFRGHDYMWPWESLVSGVVVNTDLFDKVGARKLLPLDRPNLDWTFDEFKAAAQAVSKPPNTYGYAVHGKDGMFYNYLWAVNNGASMTDRRLTKYLWDSNPKAAEGLKFLADLSADKLAPGGAAGLSFQDTYNLFLQGKIAMFPAFGMSALLADIKESGDPFKTAVVAPPHGDGSDTHVWTNSAGFMVFKQSDPYRQRMGMELGRMLTDTANCRIVAAAQEVFPARRSAEDAVADNANLVPFRKLEKFADSTFTEGYGLLPASEWDSNFQSILTGQAPPDQALKQLRELVDKELAAGGNGK